MSDFNVTKLRSALEGAGFDMVLASTPPNVAYLTGLSPSPVSLLVDNQVFAMLTLDQLSSPIIVTSSVFVDELLPIAHNVRQVVTYGEYHRATPGSELDLTDEEKFLQEMSRVSSYVQSSFAAVSQALELMKVEDKRVAVDTKGLSESFLHRLKDRFPKTRFSSASYLLGEVRKTKTEEEVELIHMAAKITEHSIMETIRHIDYGITEKEAVTAFRHAIADSDARDYFIDLKFGRSSVLTHLEAGETRLGKGDIIFIDCGCSYQGYWSDVSRVYCLGDPDEHLFEVYEALLSGHERTLAELRPAVKVSEIYDVMVSTVRDAGLHTYNRHHVGHGLGLELYEPPLLGPDNTELLEAGMIVSIETPYCELGLGMINIENMALITDTGCKRLTELPTVLGSL